MSKGPSRWMQAAKAAQRRESTKSGAHATTKALSTRVKLDPQKWEGETFGAGDKFVPSDDTIDRLERIKLYGTRNGKKPAICPECRMAFLPSGVCGSC